MGLEGLRERLDALDEQILALLSERARVVVQVAHFKRQHNLPIHIPAREASIFERLRVLNPGPLSGDAVERIYRTVIGEMREFEREHAACDSA
jgi:chorismate mutase/prephenate dehydratase